MDWALLTQVAHQSNLGKLGKNMHRLGVIANGKIGNPHGKWMTAAGQPYLSLPTKKTVTDSLADLIQGTSLEIYVDDVLQNDLKLKVDDYALEQEIEPTDEEMVSPTHGKLTHYRIFPVDVWVNPTRVEELPAELGPAWLSCDEALCDARVSPTAKKVFSLLREREARLDKLYQAKPGDEHRPESPRRLLKDVADRPSMDALAKKWLSKNRSGVRPLQEDAR